VHFATEYNFARDGHVLLFKIIFKDEEDSPFRYFEDLDLWEQYIGIYEGGLEGVTLTVGEEKFEWESHYFEYYLLDTLALVYRFVGEEDSDDKFNFDDNDMKQFQQSVLKAIDNNWDGAFVTAMKTVLLLEDTPAMSEQFFTDFYQELRKLMFEKRDGKYYWGSMYANPNLTRIVTLVGTLEVPDPCNVWKLTEYKPQALVDDKRPQTSITYTFKDDKKTFTIQYFHKKQEARVMIIDCDVKGNKCQPFEDSIWWGENYQKVTGHWDSSTIEIDKVYMGDSKNSGHCTKAVSYMLKVLLLESAKVKQYPYLGRVYISSFSPCAAVNCYTHAFINNGFLPSEKELEEFRADSTNIDFNSQGSAYDTLDFTFENFINASQKEKYEKGGNKPKRKRVVSEWIAKRVKHRRRKGGSVADRLRRRRKIKIQLKF
jgi:hypothetical protein